MASPFTSSRVSLKIALLPRDTSNPMSAVQAQLNNMLLKYNENLNGVPVAFSDLHFPKGKDSGRIISDSYWIHVDVMTSIVTFRPNVGTRLTGKITKLTDSHVSLLIYGMFNASISGEEMKCKYTYNYGASSWQSEEGDLLDGDTIEFEVVSLLHAKGVLNIAGKLV